MSFATDFTVNLTLRWLKTEPAGDFLRCSSKLAGRVVYSFPRPAQSDLRDYFLPPFWLCGTVTQTVAVVMLPEESMA